MDYALLDDNVGSPFITELSFEVQPYDLGETWNNLGKILSKFKLEFEKSKIELNNKINEYQMYKDDTTLIENTRNMSKSENVKSHFNNLLVEREQQELKYIEDCTRLTSKVEACRSILTGTEQDNFAKTFGCFACMERPVNLFFDPCGHLICATCWTKIENKLHCPICNKKIEEMKRIYPM